MVCFRIRLGSSSYGYALNSLLQFFFCFISVNLTYCDVDCIGGVSKTEEMVHLIMFHGVSKIEEMVHLIMFTI